MRKTLAAAFLICFLVAPLQAEDKTREEANEMLRKASDLETFKPGEAPKFRFEVRFTFLRQGKEEARGLYTRETDSAALWHEELEFGKFRYHKVRIKRQVWTRQNSDFIPLVVEGLWGALYPTRSILAVSMTVKRIKNRKINGTEARCIEYESVEGKYEETGQICVQANTGYVIFRQFGTQRITYSDFSPLGSRVRPRHFELDLGATDAVVADVNYRLVEKFDPVGFEPIVDGEVSDVCTTSTPAVAKFAPDPVYPLTVPRGAYKGKIVVDVKVAPDGHVLNDAVAQSLQQDLDAAALDGIKRWQFEPGTCDGKAITSIARVMTTYR
jgi:TonB family protein